MNEFPTLTIEWLKEILHYEPATGHFTWLVSLTRSVTVGDRAGTTNCHGRRVITIEGKKHLEHRLAWFYMRGEWPVGHIDHKNRTPLDNRFDNLRPATPAQNQQNRGKTVQNTSGLVGASRFRDRWQAQIRHDCEHTHLGFFDTAEEAHAAYVDAKRRLHTFSPELSA